MVDYTEQRNQLEQQRQQVSQAEQQAKARENELRRKSQSQLRQGGLSGLQSRQQKKKELGQIASTQRELEKVKGELTGYETQINQAEQAQRDAEAQNAQYERAVKVYMGVESGNLKDVPLSVRKQAEAQANEILAHSGAGSGGFDPYAYQIMKSAGLLGVNITQTNIPTTELPPTSSKTLQPSQEIPTLSYDPSSRYLGRVDNPSKIPQMYLNVGQHTATGNLPGVIPSQNVPVNIPTTNNFNVPSKVPQYNILSDTPNVRDIKIVPFSERQDRTTNPNEVQYKRINQLNKVSSNINRLNEEASQLARGQINDNSEWIGSNQDLESYNKKLEEIKQEQSNFNLLGGTISQEGSLIYPTKEVGLFGLTREVPINEYYTGGISEPFNVLGKELGTTTGVGVEKGLDLFGYKPTEITKPIYRKETMQYNSLTGRFEVPTITFKTQTSKEIGEGVTKGIELGVSTGKYFIPYLGLGIAGIETIETLKKYDYKPLEFFKKEPVQATLLTAGLIFPFLVRGGKALTKPTIITEKLGQTERRALTLVGKPSKVLEEAGKTTTFFEDVTGTSQTIKEGKITGVKTPLQQFFGKKLRVSEKGLELLPADLLYSGIPTGIGREERKKVLKLLVKKGFTESQVVELIKLKKPQVIENIFKGKAVVVEGEGGTRILIKGIQKEIPTLKEIGGVKTRLGEGRFRTINAEGVPVEGGTGEIELFRFNEKSQEAFLNVGKPREALKETKVNLDTIKFAREQARAKDLIPFSKLRKEGKTETTFDIVTGVKKIGEGEIPILRGLNKEETIKVYHGTSEDLAPKIFREGLKSSRKTGIYQGIQPLDFVSTGTSFEQARGFATRTAIKTGSRPFVIEANIPKSELNKLLTSSDKVSGVGEIRFKEIPVKYLGEVGVQDIGVIKLGNVEAYKEADISRQIIPRVKRISTSRSLVLVEKGEPEIIVDVNELFGIKKITGFQGGGKKSSEQFLQQMYKPNEVVSSGLSQIVKSGTIPVKIPKIAGIKTTTKLKPVVILPKQESAFYGTGQYERTEETGGRLTMTGMATKGGEREYQPLSLNEVPKTQLKEGLLDITETRFKEFPIQIPKPQSVQKEVQPPQEALRLSSKQLQKFVQVYKNKGVSQRVKTPLVPKPTVKIKNLSSVPKGKSKFKDILGETFEVFKRTKGEDISVGEEFSLKEAGSRLSKELKGGLEASGYITSKRTGKKVSFGELSNFLGEEFRPAKRDYFRVVQKKERRLGTGSETFKIQKERGKKLKWL